MMTLWAVTPESGDLSTPLALKNQVLVSGSNDLLVLDASTGDALASVDLTGFYVSAGGSIAELSGLSVADGMAFVSVGYSLVAY